MYFVHGMTKALERLGISVALYAYVKCYCRCKEGGERRGQRIWSKDQVFFRGPQKPRPKVHFLFLPYTQRQNSCSYREGWGEREEDIMYLTVVSWFLISFVMGGSSPSRANKFLYAPAPPPPSVWALNPPSWALVHKTPYAPMIYTALCIMFWMRAYPLLGQVEGGWALEILSFWAQNGIRLSARCHFTGKEHITQGGQYKKLCL